MIYLTAGSSVLFKNMGNISISISKNNKIFGSLVLADVIIVKNLDRQLFSVNTFLSKGHNRVHFSQPKAPENVLHYLSLLNKQKQPERKWGYTHDFFMQDYTEQMVILQQSELMIYGEMLTSLRVLILSAQLVNSCQFQHMLEMKQGNQGYRNLWMKFRWIQSQLQDPCDSLLSQGLTTFLSYVIDYHVHFGYVSSETKQQTHV